MDNRRNSSSRLVYRNYTISDRISDDDEILALDIMNFQILHDRSVGFFYKLETFLLAMGLFGNALAFITLMKSRQMQTPSFVYHKALVLAYLIYCLNFLIVKCVNATLTISSPNERQQLNYSNPIAAYYSVILNRVVSSVCGYVALYTSLAIGVDRFLALAMLKHYVKFNRHAVSYFWIGFSLILSVCVHSWAPWLENDIHESREEIFDGRENRTITAYRHSDTSSRDRLKPYITAKDWYNLFVRFAYAVLLTVLTSTVIYMFAKQRKKRRMLCSVSKRQIRRERSLFYLMVAVVIMAYIQVIPRETKRILELIYPHEHVGKQIADRHLPVETRRFYLLFGLYVFTFSTPILNLCTIVERSLLFYFYFVLNHSFRKEILILLHLRTLWRRMASKLGLSKNDNHKKGRRKGGINEHDTAFQTNSTGLRELTPNNRRKKKFDRFGSESSCGTPTIERDRGRPTKLLLPGCSNRSMGSTSSKNGSFYSIYSDCSSAI